jgi:hypothetical protein
MSCGQDQDAPEPEQVVAQREPFAAEPLGSDQLPTRRRRLDDVARPVHAIQAATPATENLKRLRLSWLHGVVVSSKSAVVVLTGA